MTSPSLSLEALEQLLEQGSKAPWSVRVGKTWLHRSYVASEDGTYDITLNDADNAALIVALRNSGPALLAALQAVAALLDSNTTGMVSATALREALAPFSEGAETHGT